MTAAVQHLSAEQLGLEEHILQALLFVRSRLVGGEVEHVALDRSEIPISIEVYRGGYDGFNMRYYVAQSDCGTTCCIGGSMALFLRSQGIEFDPSSLFHGEKNSSLRELFHPGGICISEWRDISAEAAVEAIDNYLLTGNPHWRDIGKKYGYGTYEELVSL